MKESLNLFKQYANHRNFASAPIVLAFTKLDEFEKTFSADSMRATFPDFKGETTEDGLKFIRERFLGLLSKRSSSALAPQVFTLDATSAAQTVDLLDHVRQLVATESAAFIKTAVEAAVAKRKNNKRRGSVTRFGSRNPSTASASSADELVKMVPHVK